MARHVYIVDENVNLVGFNDNVDKNENDPIEINNENKIQNENIEEESDNESVNSMQIPKLTPEPRSSKRDRKQPERYAPHTYANCIYVNCVSVDTPENYNEAINCSDSEKWQEAMNKEIDCLNKNNTWKLVKKPEDKKVLDLKWVQRRLMINLKR